MTKSLTRLTAQRVLVFDALRSLVHDSRMERIFPLPIPAQERIRVGRCQTVFQRPSYVRTTVREQSGTEYQISRSSLDKPACTFSIYPGPAGFQTRLFQPSSNLHKSSIKFLIPTDPGSESGLGSDVDARGTSESGLEELSHEQTPLMRKTYHDDSTISPL